MKKSIKISDEFHKELMQEKLDKGMESLEEVLKSKLNGEKKENGNRTRNE